MLVLELGHAERIEALTFAPDGRSLAAPCDPGVYIWRELANGARAALLPGPTAPRAARFTPDGRWLFAGAFEFGRLDPGGGGHTPLEVLTRGYVHFDVSPADGRVVIARGQRLVCWRAADPSPAGKLWEREQPQYTSYRPLFLPGGERFVQFWGGWVHDRRRVEYQFHTYDAATGALLGASPPRPSEPADRCVSPDGGWVAGLDLSRVTLWPVAGGEPAAIKNDSRRHFTGVAFHPSGRFLAVTSNDATVKLYDTTDWQPARTFTWKLGRMRSVAFSPDGALAAAGSDQGQVVVWDVDL